MKAEICGVLIGSEQGRTTVVEACISGVNAAQGGAHVTFTQDTWEHIYKIKDKLYPEDRIVGWYHSHPGFGVFLSDHDMFIQENFFSSPQQIAWVYDPHSDEEGCFGWCNKKVEKLDDISFRFLAGKSTVEEHQIDEDDEVEAPDDEQRGSGKKNGNWVDILLTVLTYCFVFAFGGLAGAFIWGGLLDKINFMVPRSVVMQRQMVLLPGAVLIPGAAFDPELDQCLTRFTMNEAAKRQQMNDTSPAPSGASVDLGQCIGQFEMRQSMRQNQQTDSPLMLRGIPSATPSAAGSPNGSQGSSAIRQPSQTGGQDGSQR